MRETKYRAWEKNLKEIIPVHNIDFEKKMINTESAWRTFDEIELIQYTGLKDKNGNEIYEGDIVQRIYESGSKFVGDVVFDEATYFLRNSEEFAFLSNQYDSETLQILGNIYEHPELLGDSN